jgi:hypothetical protein
MDPKASNRKILLFMRSTPDANVRHSLVHPPANGVKLSHKVNC